MKNTKLSADTRFTFERFNAMDKERLGTLPEANKNWNVSGGPRVHHIVNKILEHVAHRPLDRLSVLNMSGLLEGKPDPVLFDLVYPALGSRTLEWTILDHPSSETFSNPRIREWIEKRGMRSVPQDFRREITIDRRSADIVLCTEILEHLDYTSAIRLLQKCREALRPGGRLIITTPNAVYLLHRVFFALGYWDFLHHMDGPDDVDCGVLGHIVYYDSVRLTRLLGMLNFVNITTRTFNAGHGPGEYRNRLTRLAAISLRAMSKVLSKSGQVLLVTADRPSI